jgi:uncharacterized membrane protein YhaH (DUF805 family)
MSQAEGRAGRQAFWLTVAAFVWSAALVGAAFVLPLYGGSSTSSTGVHPSASLTLVQINGPRVLIPMGLPLIIVALAWAALHRKCSRGGRVPGYVAWTFVGVLAAGCLAGIASVGWLIVPVAGLLSCAAAITPTGGTCITSG